MVSKRVNKVAELTAGGFIRESTSQLRSGRMVVTVELLDPNPDCYKVYMKSVTVRKRNKPQDKQTMEWSIARPFDGHMPKGGYDVFGPDNTPVHFDTFAAAKSRVDVESEQFIEYMTNTEKMVEDVQKPVPYNQIFRR